MKRVVLCQHIGLGDHIICNAITREYAFICDEVILPVRECNLTSVRFMFRDRGNITVLPISGWDELKSEGQWLQRSGAKVIWFGFNAPPFNPKIFDREFYRQASMDFSYKWDRFKLKRDHSREFVEPGEYIFLHDDPSRGFKIDRSKIKSDLKIVTNTSRGTDNLFDWCGLIENAKEVHCINSCTMNLIEHLKPKGKLVWHFYARPEDTIMELRQNWRRI